MSHTTWFCRARIISTSFLCFLTKYCHWFLDVICLGALKMVPNIISVCTCNLSRSTEKWCQVSFLYEKKYSRYVQRNFLSEPHGASLFRNFSCSFLFYLFFCVCRVFSCSALPNVSFSTGCNLALDGTYTFLTPRCAGGRGRPLGIT